MASTGVTVSLTEGASVCFRYYVVMSKHNKAKASQVVK